MLSVSMVLGNVTQCKAFFVISEDGDRREHLVLVMRDPTEVEAERYCFLSRLSECHILSFGGGQGHSALFLA
jgi:hypothetical protein